MIKFKGLILTVLLFSCSSFAINVETLVLEKKDYGDIIEFRTGSSGSLEIPLSFLSGTKVSSIGGLVFLLKNKASFSVETVTARSTGFDNVDMSTWPEYLLGSKTNGEEPKGFIDDLLLSKEVVIDQNISPFSIKKFTTKEGIGYWGEGKSKSIIILVDKQNNNQVVVLYTNGMSSIEIKKLIINGVIK